MKLTKEADYGLQIAFYKFLTTVSLEKATSKGCLLRKGSKIEKR